MGIFSTRKNKKYSYSPRHYKGEGNPFEIKHKFDEHRVTASGSTGFKTKINNAISDYKGVPDYSGANRRVAIIVAALVLIFLFIIEFDLSIFFPNS